MANWNGEVASREQIREQKRRAALRIASRLFNEKGYHATSLDEIADQIGVTKTALYYYFRNKEELLFECLQVTFRCAEEAMDQAAPQGGALERLTALYVDFASGALEQTGAYLTPINIRALPRGMQADLQARMDRLVAILESLIAEAMQAGALRDRPPRATAHLLISTVNWLMSWHLENPSGEDARTIAAAFLDQWMTGLAQPARAPA